MDANAVTASRQCGHCAYFHQEELNTGHCRFHDMYVLRDFDCEKFEQRSPRTEGGERPTEN